jgi:6-phosphogluconolactonase
VSIRIFDTLALLYHAAAATVARLAGDAVSARGRFLLVLSGGATPLPLFERLAQPPYRDQVPWAQTDVFWADERMVPAGHEESNFGRARSALLRHVPIPDAQLHPVNGDLDAQQASDGYANELARFAAPGQRWPRFDLVLLGLGADGHTASLFPTLAGQIPDDAAVWAVEAPDAGRPVSRVTLTPAAINDARDVIFLVVGRDKAQALAQALTPGVHGHEWPARLIQPVHGGLTWFVDKDAASLLDHSPPGSRSRQGYTPQGVPDD